MRLNAIKKVVFFIYNLLIIYFFFNSAVLSQPASEKLPWEDPNSGFNSKNATVRQSSSNSNTKIEVITKTSGGARNDGKTTSNEGTQQQKEFVDNFLKDAAQKIKNSAGGYGWVWTWEKKWKIGPDGKPYEVKESWHRGEVNTNAQNQEPPSSQSPSQQQSSASNSSNQATDNLPPKISKSNLNQPNIISQSATPATPNNSKHQSSNPSSTTNQSQSAKNQAPKDVQNTQSPNTISTPRSINIAPPQIPPAEIQLIIQNPVNNSESVYSANVFPHSSSFKPITLVAKNEPIPEDTRVKISLDFDTQKIKPENLKLIIKDNEGDSEVNKDDLKNYRHIFRVPNQTDYKAIVYYNSPKTRQTHEIINVSIPVYPMNFENRTIDSAQHRSNSESITGGAYNSNSTYNANSQNYTDSYSTFNVSTRSNYNSSDLSDLYASTREYNSPLSMTDNSQNQTVIAQLPENLSNLNISTSDNNQQLINTENFSDQSVISQITTNSLNQQNANIHENKSNISENFIDSGNINNISYQNQENKSSQKLASNNPIKLQDQNTIKFSSQTTTPNNQLQYHTSISKNFNYNKGRSNSSSNLANSQSFALSRLNATTSSSSKTKQSSTEGYEVTTTNLYSNSSDNQEISQTNPAYQIKTPDKEYILSLSLLNTKTNHAQSFDFISDPYPTASKVSVNTNLNFSIDLSKDVNRDSVVIVIYDGKNKSEYNLQTLQGDAFSYSFNHPTQEAYIWIYGNTSKKPFSYKLSIPIVE